MRNPLLRERNRKEGRAGLRRGRAGPYSGAGVGHGEQPPRESRIHEIHKLQPSTWTFQVPTERYIQTLRHTDTIMNTYTLTETQTGTSLVEVLK